MSTAYSTTADYIACAGYYGYELTATNNSVSYNVNLYSPNIFPIPPYRFNINSFDQSGSLIASKTINNSYTIAHVPTSMLGIDASNNLWILVKRYVPVTYEIFVQQVNSATAVLSSTAYSMSGIATEYDATPLIAKNIGTPVGLVYTIYGMTETYCVCPYITTFTGRIHAPSKFSLYYTSTTRAIIPMAINADANGNTYVVLYDSTYGNTSLLKINVSGGIEWQRNYAISIGADWRYPSDFRQCYVAFDGANNVYVVQMGLSYTASNAELLYIIKYDSDGNPIFFRKLDVTYPSGYTDFGNVVIKSTNIVGSDLYITLYYTVSYSVCCSVYSYDPQCIFKIPINGDLTQTFVNGGATYNYSAVYPSTSSGSTLFAPETEPTSSATAVSTTPFTAIVGSASNPSNSVTIL